MGSDEGIEHSVCTLGGQGSWRRIKSNVLYYYCNDNGVCIDGVVYYEACLEEEPCGNSMVVSSFDVASEQLHLIKTPEKMVAQLTNYLGKLAAYDFSNDNCLVLWVLDDVKNQVWSKKTCVFSSFTHSLFLDLRLHFAGVTAAGEIVYVPLSFSDPFELFTYHVEKKVERRVRVEGVAVYFEAQYSWNCIRSPGSTCRWAKVIWFSHNTPKYAFITWLALRDRLSTCERMIAWGTQSNVSCTLCNAPLETRAHLFFECPYSETVWTTLVSKIMNQNFSSTWEEIVTNLQAQGSDFLTMFILRFCFQLAIHSLWRERNRRRNGEQKMPVNQLCKILDKMVRNRLSTEE